MLRIIVTGRDTLANTVYRSLELYEGPTEHSIRINADFSQRKSADLLWICYDTPEILPTHAPDVNSVLSEAGKDIIQFTGPETFVLVSSQLPVGSTRRLEQRFPLNPFGHYPENIRVKTAMEDFARQERIIIGLRKPDMKWKLVFENLLKPFTSQLIFTDIETAEFTKQALNGWLALNIAYINEIAEIAIAEGVDPDRVAEFVRLDPRVSPRAPLRPGAPYGGGHLEREVYNLEKLAIKHAIVSPLIENIDLSNRMKTR